jgi:ABC-type proline/glycine betaine transport system permease subunit
MNSDSRRRKWKWPVWGATEEYRKELHSGWPALKTKRVLETKSEGPFNVIPATQYHYTPAQFPLNILVLIAVFSHTHTHTHTHTYIYIHIHIYICIIQQIKWHNKIRNQALHNQWIIIIIIIIITVKIIATRSTRVKYVFVKRTPMFYVFWTVRCDIRM